MLLFYTEFLEKLKKCHIFVDIDRQLKTWKKPNGVLHKGGHQLRTSGRRETAKGSAQQVRRIVRPQPLFGCGRSRRHAAKTQEEPPPSREQLRATRRLGEAVSSTKPFGWWSPILMSVSLRRILLYENWSSAQFHLQTFLYK